MTIEFIKTVLSGDWIRGPIPAPTGKSPENPSGTASQEAEQTGSDSAVEGTTQTCPQCKVAIVVGHNTAAPGAFSSTIGEAEFPYNTDIAERTRTKIQELDPTIEVRIFNRVAGGSYAAEVARCYAEVNAFLSNVPAPKRISIELHFNSADDSSAHYALTIYKGDTGFATSSAQAMAAIYGGRHRTWNYVSNDRGKATFANGPANTYLMEPFFGSHPASATIAGSEDGRNRLAEAYAKELVNWIRK